MFSLTLYCYVKKLQDKCAEDPGDCRNESKIAWKIRAQRKRQQKHLTLGLTREEFANIQESLKYRPLEGKKSPMYHQKVHA